MSERWKPERTESYYYIKSNGEVATELLYDDEYDYEYYERGNCFRTEAEAQAAAEKVRELLLSLHEEQPVTDDCNQLPKLTVDVFSLHTCPEWARHAAVDSDGEARYHELKPIATEYWWFSSGDIKCADYGKFDASDWQNSLVERPVKLPKLTTEIFDLPHFPKTADYAVVTKDGGITAYTHKPYINEEIPCWGFNRGCCFTVETAGAYDSSDWQNSLIERPVKEDKLPDWCKVGEFVYDPNSKVYFKIKSINNESIVLQDPYNEDVVSNLYIEFFIAQNPTQAHLRPYNTKEMKALVGRTVAPDYGAVFLVTKFVDTDEGGEVCIDGIYYNNDRLLNGFTIDGNPCGKLEHLNEKGEWVE